MYNLFLLDIAVVVIKVSNKIEVWVESLVEDIVGIEVLVKVEIDVKDLVEVFVVVVIDEVT